MSNVSLVNEITDMPASLVSNAKSVKQEPSKYRAEQSMDIMDTARKILVVDDDASIRSMLHTMLELEGYQVLEARDGKECLEKVSFLEPHLIVLDLMMPNLDGFEVCQRLRKNVKTREIPVLIMSVRGNVEDKVAGLGCGADDYIPKPFDPTEFIARVRAHLRKIDLLAEKNIMLERLAGKLAALNLDLREQAVTDGLTGLYNHRYFIQRLHEESARVVRHGGKFSIIMFDLDHFKEVNDRYGHLSGDAVLREVARLLQEAVRGVDSVARYGGEEFALLLPETTAGGAHIVAERIRMEVANHPFVEVTLKEKEQKRPIVVTISGGIAAFPLHSEETVELIWKADTALYSAKQSGRNRILVWTG